VSETQFDGVYFNKIQGMPLCTALSLLLMNIFSGLFVSAVNVHWSQWDIQNYIHVCLRQKSSSTMEMFYSHKWCRISHIQDWSDKLVYWFHNAGFQVCSSNLIVAFFFHWWANPTYVDTSDPLSDKYGMQESMFWLNIIQKF
jgi:hypothetical protein